MIFQAAYNYMKRGRKITLPEWCGYWYWSKEKEIHLGDLFLSEVNYQDELTQKVKAEIKKRDKEEAYSFFKEVHSATKFYFSSEGLVLLYSPYEIAPRVEGTVRVILPWQELRNILKEEFRSL